MNVLQTLVMSSGMMPLADVTVLLVLVVSVLQTSALWFTSIEKFVGCCRRTVWMVLRPFEELPSLTTLGILVRARMALMLRLIRAWLGPAQRTIGRLADLVTCAQRATSLDRAGATKHGASIDNVDILFIVVITWVAVT